MSFKTGDLVVVMGVKSESTGQTVYKQSLATVIEVGKYDLFATLQTSPAAYKSSVFRTSKALCAKVTLPRLSDEVSLKKPKIGDLVLSVTQSFSSEKIERKSGILKEIKHLSWQVTYAKILIGNKYEEVPYNSLIVLEE